MVSCYGEAVNGGECDHPLLLLTVEVIGRHPAGPVLLVPQLVQLGQELFLNPHFPGSPHSLDVVDGVDGLTLRTAEQLARLLVEATAASEEEAVLVLDGVEGKYWLMGGSEADTGVAATTLGMLTLTVARLTNGNGRNEGPGPALWWSPLWLDFISWAPGCLDLDLARVINIVGEGGQGGLQYPGLSGGHNQ